MAASVKKGARWGHRAGLAFVVALTLFAMASMAVADDLKADLDAVPTDTTITEGDSTTAAYLLTAQKDSGEPTTGQPTCNASSGSPVAVTIASDPASGLTISPNPFNLTGCGGGNGVLVEFTGDTAGVYDLTATTSGGSGATITTSQASWTLTVEEAEGGDTEAPETSIDSGPSDPSHSTSATFTFSGTDDVSDPADLTFECKLDSGAWEACTSPKEYLALGVGSHTFKVKATDEAANTDQSPATHTWGIEYEFFGFKAPIDNGMFNKAKAGQTVPVKWQLKLDGAYVSDLTAVQLKYGAPQACGLLSEIAVGTDAIESYASGQTILRYDSIAQQFVFNWQTSKGYAPDCGSVSLYLNDGSTGQPGDAGATPHTAAFKFAK